MAQIGYSNGVAYYKGDGDATPEPPPRRPLWRSVVVFILVFVALQALWSASRGTWLESLVIHDATVRPATVLINLISPAAQATPAGSRIRAEGGGLNILNGCEGTEVAFLLIAAFAATQMRWRTRLLGLALGVTLVWVLNQVRVLALFYSFRLDKPTFDMLHTTIAPVVLVIAVAAYFQLWLQNAGAKR